MQTDRLASGGLRPWQEFVPEVERAVYQKAGFWAREPRLGDHPALLIIDVTQSFTGGPDPDHVQGYATTCVGAWEAVREIARVLEACRQRAVPVIYTTGDRAGEAFYGGATKRPRTAGDDNPLRDVIPPLIAPREGDLVLRKARASAFFNTSLANYLHRLQVDSLLVTGTATSGCVRASVVDAFSHGFAPLVVEEGTFDRSPTLRLANLFDMGAKYAEVITVQTALDLLAARRPGQPIKRGG